MFDYLLESRQPDKRKCSLFQKTAVWGYTSTSGSFINRVTRYFVTMWKENLTHWFTEVFCSICRSVPTHPNWTPCLQFWFSSQSAEAAELCFCFTKVPKFSRWYSLSSKVSIGFWLGNQHRRRFPSRKQLKRRWFLCICWYINCINVPLLQSPYISRNDRWLRCTSGRKHYLFEIPIIKEVGSSATFKFPDWNLMIAAKGEGDCKHNRSCVKGFQSDFRLIVLFIIKLGRSFPQKEAGHWNTLNWNHLIQSSASCSTEFLVKIEYKILGKWPWKWFCWWQPCVYTGYVQQRYLPWRFSSTT